MLIIICSLIAVLLLAFSNGANDNFKGVATLLGSKTATHRQALTWATLTTFAGSLTAVLFAQELLANFSGRGLVPEQIVNNPAFSSAVALAAGLTVLLATKLGFPISTTHAIVGALAGAGFVASAEGVNTTKLMSSFFLPLIFSPFASIVATVVLYSVFKAARRRLGIERKSCLCIGQEVIQIAPASLPTGTLRASFSLDQMPELSLGTMVSCEERYTGKVLGITAKPLLDRAHFFTAGLVSFSRGLNDAPKIAAIMLTTGFISSLGALSVVAVVMALGGLLYSKKISQTMSFDITEMNDGQGFTSNLVTGLIVIGASRLGLPVSTTHVSCGSLFGIGFVTGKAKKSVIMKIVLSWITTLPLATALGALSFSTLR